MPLQLISGRPWSAPITTNAFNYISNTYIASINPFKDNVQIYRLFLDIKRQYTGMYSVETDDDNFLDVENDFLSYLWVLRELFVTRIDNKYQLWEVVKRHYDGNKVFQVEARLATDSNKDNDLLTYMFTNEIHGIYVKWEVELLSAYYYWFPILTTISKMLESARISAKFDAKKLIKVVNHTNKLVLRQEQEELLDETNPFITIYKKILEEDEVSKEKIEKPIIGSTKYTELKNQSTTEQIWKNITNMKAFWWNSAGLPMPNEARPSGKKDGESLVEIYGNLLNETVTLKNLKNFAIKAEKLWKIKMVFSKSIDLIKTYLPEKEELNGRNIQDSEIKGD